MIILLFIIILFFLCGYNFIIINPAGYIAKKQSQFFIISIFLLSIIILPTIIFFIYILYKYNINNYNDYLPYWNKSNTIEIVIWFFPFIIILILSYLTWNNTHYLDPSKKILILNEKKNFFFKPLIIQVISLDWKWLFIYKKAKIASINELILPINIPILLKITSLNNMNSFNIPGFAGQIYSMPNMENLLNIVANKKGIYDGFSSNYSGKGFTNMRFKIYVLKINKFNKWINFIKNINNNLNIYKYKKIINSINNNNIIYFSKIENNIYYYTLNKYNLYDK